MSTRDSGRPVSMKADQNVEKTRTFMRTNRRLGVRMIVEKLNMDKETERQILATDLNMK